MTDNGWSEYQKLVLSKLDEVAVLREDMNEKHTENRDAMASMKSRLDVLDVRITIWGALAMAVPGILIIGFELWRSLR